jgi:hypothetical protein
MMNTPLKTLGPVGAAGLQYVTDDYLIYLSTWDAGTDILGHPNIITCTRCSHLPSAARCPSARVGTPLAAREGRHEPCFPETSAIASLPISGDE